MKQRVKIQKIGAAANALAPTPDNKDYVPGEVNEGVSLPVEYCIEGYLLKAIEHGVSVVIDRYARNGVSAVGMFVSSPVIEFDSTTFTTYNSIYSIEYLD
jgi:hypothetical protein